LVALWGWCKDCNGDWPFERAFGTLATVVMVGGEGSVKCFGEPALAGYQLFTMNQDEENAWEI